MELLQYCTKPSISIWSIYLEHTNNYSTKWMRSGRCGDCSAEWGNGYCDKFVWSVNYNIQWQQFIQTRKGSVKHINCLILLTQPLQVTYRLPPASSFISFGIFVKSGILHTLKVYLHTLELPFLAKSISQSTTQPHTYFMRSTVSLNPYEFSL